MTSGPGEGQAEGPLHTDVWSCGKMWAGRGSYLPVQDLRLATEEAVAVVTAQVNAPLRACALEGRKTSKGRARGACWRWGGAVAYSLLCPGLPTPILTPSLGRHTLYPWSRV